MRIRSVILAVAAALLVCLGGQPVAQVRPVEPVPPRVMSGSDIGFRVEGLRGERVVGRLVVRVDGRWVETELTAAPLQLSTR